MILAKESTSKVTSHTPFLVDKLQIYKYINITIKYCTRTFCTSEWKRVSNLIVSVSKNRIEIQKLKNRRTTEERIVWKLSEMHLTHRSKHICFSPH